MAGYITNVNTDDLFIEITDNFTPDIWVPDGYDFSDNLLTNSGFEANLYDWTTDLSRIHTDVIGVAHGGGKYLESTGTATNYTYQSIDLLALGFSENQLDSQNLTLYLGGWISTGSTDYIKIETILELDDESEKTLDLAGSKAVQLAGIWLAVDYANRGYSFN